MKDSLLDKIPRDSVGNIQLYRLGVFGNSSFEFVELSDSKDYPEHHHNNSEAEFFFIIGKGTIILDGKKHKYFPSSKFIINKGMRHGFKPSEPTLLLSIQTPPIKNTKTGKEDIHF